MPRLARHLAGWRIHRPSAGRGEGFHHKGHEEHEGDRRVAVAVMTKPRREERERNPDEGYGVGRGMIFAAFAASREMRNCEHRASAR